MKGKTEIKVTPETMVAAMQMYMDVQFAEGKAPRVTGVQQVDGYNSATGFMVMAESAESAEPSTA